MPEILADVYVAGRAQFVLALRRRYHTFWQSLNEVWRSRDVSRFDSWCEERRVCDPWLKDMCLETLASWDAEPAGPNATLAPDYPWFRFSQAGYETPEFSPSFEKPGPFYTSSFGVGKELLDVFAQTKGTEVRKLADDIKVESLEEFERRMQSQFDKQLRAYIKLIRENFDYGHRTKMTQHADWTVLRFAGVSIACIIDEFCETSEDVIDESTVRKSIDRFAGRIGLTIRQAKDPAV